MQKKNFVIIFIVVSVSLNIIGFYLLFINRFNIVSFNKVDDQQKQFPFLAKRIFNENFSDIILNFLDLRNDIKSITAPFGDSFSMYFEYLPTGTSININATDEFHAASLFKLPVVMAYYHQQERLKLREDPIITLQQSDLDSEFGDLYKKGAGYKIRLSNAVKLALQESDNTAIKLVVPRITQDDFENIYQSLDIDLNTDKNGAILTTKGYASILKALYFSSVLTKQDSENILNLLTKTKFVDKLPSGVPENIPVAHKIGVFNKNKDEDEAFMDCGIVYVPNRPYSLCMLSRSDEQTARERMANISRKIYDYISSTEK